MSEKRGSGEGKSNNAASLEKRESQLERITIYASLIDFLILEYTMTDYDDYPEIGDERDGRILLCHGDDQPEELIGWLEPIWKDFSQLQNLSWDFNLQLRSKKHRKNIDSFDDLFSLAGIETESGFWEGSLVSGHYIWCWVDVNKEEDAIAKLNDILSTLSESIKSKIKSKAIKELKEIDDLDEFIDRITVSSGSDQRLKKLQDENERLSNELTKKHEINIELSCIEILSALFTKSFKRVVAGPIVLWEDGNVFVITSIGGVEIPTGTSVSLLYETLKEADYPFIAAEECASIRSPHTGRRCYHKVSSGLSGWEKVWYQKKITGRVFKSDTPENTEKVNSIYKILSS
ncbi:MAG: hypothetical protein ABW124_05335 [Candidatus Thiodiazotropha sp. 6PLUC9]